MIPVSCSEGDVNIAVTTHISITFSLMLHSSPIRHLMVWGRTFCSASARAQMSEAQTRGRNHLLAATFPSRFSITFANKIFFKRKYFTAVHLTLYSSSRMRPASTRCWRSGNLFLTLKLTALDKATSIY